MKTIEKGQKYVAQEDQRRGDIAERHIEVISSIQDPRGRIDVFSVNKLLGTTRRIQISAKRLASAAYKLIPVLALLLCAASARAWGHKTPAAAPVPKVIACAPAPIMLINDAKGTPASAVFPCFRDDGVMTYATRPLTAAEIQGLTAQAAPKSAPARKAKKTSGVAK